MELFQHFSPHFLLWKTAETKQSSQKFFSHMIRMDHVRVKHCVKILDELESYAVVLGEINVLDRYWLLFSQLSLALIIITSGFSFTLSYLRLIAQIT